jgi:hypothetical protein
LEIFPSFGFLYFAKEVAHVVGGVGLLGLSGGLAGHLAFLVVEFLAQVVAALQGTFDEGLLVFAFTDEGRSYGLGGGGFLLFGLGEGHLFEFVDAKIEVVYHFAELSAE